MGRAGLRKNQPFIACLAAIVAGAVIGICYFGIKSQVSANAFLTACIFPVSLWLMHRESGIFRLNRIGIGSFWFFTYLPMVCIPAFSIYAQRPSPYREVYLFSVVSVLLTVPLGIMIANRIWRFRPDEMNAYFSAPVHQENDDFRFRLFIFFIAAIILVMADYFVRLKVIPFFYMLEHPNEVDRLTLLREEAFKLFDPRWSSSGSTRMFYVYLFLRTVIFPFLIVVSLGHFLVTKRPRWFAVFTALMLLGVFYAASSIARAPVAAIFLRIGCLIYIYKSGLLSRRLLVILLVLILLFPTVVTALAYGNIDGFLHLAQKMIKRLSYSTAFGLYYYFEIFPEHHPFLWGQTLLKPFLQFFTKDFFYIENYVYKYAFPHGIPSGHENDAFISNFYADFGVAGVLIGGLIVGIIMQGIQIYLARSRKDVLNISLYAFMMYAFWVLHQGSLTSVLFVNGVIPVFLFVWLIRRVETFKSPLRK